MAVDPKDIKIVDIETDGDECSVEYSIGRARDTEGFVCDRKEIESMNSDELKAHIAKNYADDLGPFQKVKESIENDLNDTILFRPATEEMGEIFRFDSVRGDTGYEGAIDKEEAYKYAVGIMADDVMDSPESWDLSSDYSDEEVNAVARRRVEGSEWEFIVSREEGGVVHRTADGIYYWKE